jgi:hypothetical protein
MNLVNAQSLVDLQGPNASPHQEENADVERQRNIAKHIPETSKR